MFPGTISRIEESMSAKLVFPSALVLAVLPCFAAYGQGPPAMNKTEAVAPAPSTSLDTTPPAETPAPTPPPVSIGLSNWITYACPDCCGPVGGDGPIKDELYIRTGPSFPVSGPIFGHVLTTGWEVQGGGRSLFFNPDRDRAWSVDLSISSIWNGGQHADRKFPLFLLAQPSANSDVFRAFVLGTLKNMNRTSVNLALGREWFLMGPAASCGCNCPNWRVGIDAGGGYGSQSASVEIDTIPGIPATDVTNPAGAATQIHLLRRRTDTIASTFLGLHSDVEIPCGCCVFMAGLRAELSYTWSDILQRQNDSNMLDVNLLITCGVRF
jgi:hypothetical protein